MASKTTNLALTLRPDKPLVQNANYAFDARDRQYIDLQILALQQHVADSLINGVHATWFLARRALETGDVVCSEGGELGVTLFTPDAPAVLAGGQPLGIVLEPAANGGRVRVGTAGLFGPNITGVDLAGGIARVSALGRVEVVDALVDGDVPLGTVDPSGVLSFAPATPFTPSAAGGFTDGSVAPVLTASTAALPANTYSSTAGGTMTANANGVFPTVGNATVGVGKRFLYKDDPSGIANGLWVLTDAGSGGTPWIATRAADANTDALVQTSMTVGVQTGDNRGQTFYLNTPAPISLGTTPLEFLPQKAEVDARVFTKRDGTDDRANLQNAAAAGRAIAYGPSTYTIKSDGSVGNETSAQVFAAGSLIVPDPGKTITLNGVVVARTNQPIFDITGGDVVLDGQSNTIVPPTWYGVLPDAGDVTSLLVRTANDIGDNVTIDYQVGTYTLAGPATIGKPTQTHKAERGTVYDITGPITFDGRIDWPDAAVLTGSGGVTFAQPLPDGAKAIWFGASESATDNIPALTRAYAAASTVQHTPGVYQCAAGTIGTTADHSSNFVRGAMLKPTGPVVVRGQVLVPGDQQIVDLTGGGSVTFVDVDNVHPGWFGARADGIADDTIPIQAAVASRKAAAKGSVTFAPAGTYLISDTIRIDFDDATIEGNNTRVVTNRTTGNGIIPILAQGTTTDNDVAPIKNLVIRDMVIEHLQAGPDSAGAIQINNVQGGHLLNVRIFGDAAGMSNTKADGIACGLGTSDVLIEECTIDGLSKGFFYLSGCSRVTLLGCVAKNGVESINPVTIGLSIGNARDCSIIGCHFFNMRGYGSVLSAGIGQVTAAISGVACSVTASSDLVGATAHGYSVNDKVVFASTANGLTAGTVYYIIAGGFTANAFKVSLTLGGSAVDITSDGTNTVTNQTRFRFTCATSVGKYVASGIGVFDTTTKQFEELKVLSATAVGGTTNHQWDIVLVSAPVFTLTASMTINVDFYPPQRIVFSACTCTEIVAGTGDGSVAHVIQSELQGVRAADITYEGCLVQGSVLGATAQGFSCNQMQGVRYVNCVASGCALGIIAQDVGPGALYPDGSPAENLCNDVQIIGGAYHDNTDTQIWIASVNDVFIKGPRVFQSTNIGAVGIAIRAKTVVTTNKRASNVHIDADFSGFSLANAAIYHPTIATDHPSSGCYVMQWPDRPDGAGQVKYAPPGSTWLDTSSPSTGLWTCLAGFDGTGWARQHTDSDTVSLTQAVRAWATGADGALALSSKGNGNVAIMSSSGGANLVLFSPAASSMLMVINSIEWLEGQTPSIFQDGCTSDAATHDLNITSQAPYASATGANRNSGAIKFTTPAAAAGGTAGSVLVKPGNVLTWEFGQGSFGAFGHAPATKQSITGHASAFASLAEVSAWAGSIMSWIGAHGLATDSTT